jgi:hypothetical protein
MNKSLIGLALAAGAVVIAPTTTSSAFALPLTQDFAAALPPATLTADQADIVGQGNIVAIVPAASIGLMDSSAKQLRTGRSYSDKVLIWVAPSAPGATVYVSAQGAAVLHRSSAKLHVGAVNLVDCAFRTTTERNGTTSISVTVDVPGYPPISRTFVHVVTS